MRIIDKRKFIKSIGITLALVIVLVLLFMKTSLSHTEINYKKISVVSGDTLWKIAKCEMNTNAYFEEKDIREIVDEIKYHNHLENSNLSVGDELIIPTI